MTAASQADLLQQSNRVYDRYVRPLEKDHHGEYAAVAAEGQLVLAPSLPEVMKKAEQVLPPGAFLFKVGEIAVDRWR
jgi:hypothetical protein